MIIHFIDFPFSCISHAIRYSFAYLANIHSYNISIGIFPVYTKTRAHGKRHEKQKFQITDERRQITSHSKLWQHKLYRTYKSLCARFAWARVCEWERMNECGSCVFMCVCVRRRETCLHIHDAWKVEIKQSNDSNNNGPQERHQQQLRQRQISGYILHKASPAREISSNGTILSTNDATHTRPIVVVNSWSKIYSHN